MTEPKTTEINNHLGNGEVENDEFPTNQDEELPSFDYKNNVTSAHMVVSYVAKCWLLKFAIAGADKMLKDQKAKKINFLANGFEEKEESKVIDNHRVSSNEYTGNENSVLHGNDRNIIKKRNYKGKRILLEKERVLFNDEYVHVSKVISSPFGGYNEFPLNVFGLLAVLLMKFIEFQFNLLVSFITFPIWLSYFSFMCVLFPFQTLRHIRGYLMGKLLKFWGVSKDCVTEKAKKSMAIVAIRFGWAFFWSVYVCFMLLGLLVSGFVFGGIMMKYLVEKPIHTTEIMNFDYTQSSPVAFVPIMSSGVGHASSLTIRDNEKTEKHVSSTRVIPYNHKLQLTVSLTVPESEYNRKLGVFQVKVEFLSANGKVTASSRYPCMMKFKSRAIQFVETIIKSVPLIAGFQSESQILNVKMNEFTEGLEPTACLKVILEQRAEYKAGGGIPEIYAASLALESKLPQLKRIIWAWRRTIFVWLSIISFLSELMMIFIFCRQMIIPRGRPQKIYYPKKGSSWNAISW